MELKNNLQDLDGLVERSVGNKYSAIFKKRKGSKQDSVDIQQQTYYIKNLEYHLQYDTESVHGQRAKKHLIETFASIKYIQTIRKPSDETMTKSKFTMATLEPKPESTTSSK